MAWIVAAFIVLSSIYSVATPIFESPDEWLHYPLVKHLADGNDLPVQDPEVGTPWQQEGSQPPLYYWWMAFATRWIDTGDAPERLYRNPFAAVGDASLEANRNIIIHTPAEDFPWHGTTLAVHLIRFLSIGMGALTVALGYAIARRAFPERRSIALGTASLIAFNPMFAFLSGTVNNDNLVILWSTLAIYLLVGCMTESSAGVDARGWLRRAALGVVVGLAALTKVSGLTLLPVIGLGLTIRHLRRRDGSGWIASALLVAVPVAVIAGWWYARNAQLYGEWLGLDVMVAVYGQPRALPGTWPELIGEFEGFRFSYWAVFGIFNILTFAGAYPVFDVFSLAALVGWGGYVARAWRHGERDRVVLLALLALFVMTVLAGLLRWTIMIASSQGRLVFPAIAAIALMLWLGWDTLWSMLGERIGLTRLREARWSMPIFLFALAAVAPFRDIFPVYAGPAVLTPDQLPAGLNILNVDYGDVFRLIGYAVDPRSGREGTAEFTLYWQCLRRPPADYGVFAIVYGRGLQEVGKRDAFPNRGQYATRLCSRGTIFVDPYRIKVKADADRPTVLRAQIGLRDWEQNTDLPASVGSLLIEVGKLAPIAQEAGPAFPAAWRLGDAVELVGYSLPAGALPGQPVRLTLYWRDLATLSESYTVFAHLLDAEGQLVDQANSPPVNGEYPTQWWSPGEIVVDDHVFDLPTDAPAGEYQVALGLYRLSDGVRLPIVGPDGAAAPDGRLLLEQAVRVSR